MGVPYDDENCSNCKFFEGGEKECVRFPPTVDMVGAVMDGVGRGDEESIRSRGFRNYYAFPIIDDPEITWCGEWKKREE